MVCEKMAQMHQIKVVRPESADYETLRDQTASFAKLAKWIPEVLSTETNRNEVGGINEQFGELGKIFDFLRAKIIEFRLPIVFCHNDLVGYNILHVEAQNDVSFIDWEYAGINFQFNDFGNMFWEHSG